MLVRRVWPSRPAFENPTNNLDQLRREMLRIFGGTSDGDANREAGVFPPLNVSQDEDNFYLRAELPGIAPSDLSISAIKNRVSIAGKREIKHEREVVSYHRKERAEGAFNRTITLPADLDAERVDAHYTDGVLVLTLPKAEETKPRQIIVKA